MEDLIKIKPDKEKARSLISLAKLRLSKFENYDIEKESVLIIEAYYEVAKELITSILLIEGYKTLSHVSLINYIKSIQEFTSPEINLLNQLRQLRNGIVYYGESVQPSYVKRNKRYVLGIISKLFEICNKKLK